MPPKDSKKPKADVKKDVPATPDKQKAKAKPAAAPKTPAASSTETPKKTPSKKATVSFNQLTSEGSVVPVTVEVEGDSGHAIQRKANTFGQILKLSASETFSVVKTITFTSGELEGCQAIIIRPPKAFDFKSLTPEVRGRIYRFYFASKGIVDADIVLDGKRSSNKEVYAKTYAEGLKNRVGLLALNKEFGKEAQDIFYAHTIRFDSSSTLIDFVSATKTLLPRLHSIALKNYAKTSARNAMHFLADATNLQRLRIDQGVVVNEQDTAKAAKNVYGDMYKFLETVGAVRGDKAAGVELLSFGKGALTWKDKKGEVRNYSEEMVEEFKENLRAKLK
ncbi:hypothetical protein M409DRAFT_25643 [Zasmidium cellare ATCC 36951]|uniref:Uncharacterized protein n=1 Tax=Zasmidium cellare ATCC 36951 TaxID=1080233 RepID=A0A6A6CCE7_ZASCE|nr:uncharacterized protein M409DRAFT_25643 [Zasmidium cellare ATCC 36951]KAF2163868.1 hypothetical protein M409DRAFT_25643 [Zasmidium cellare ATCC 36951]